MARFDSADEVLRTRARAAVTAKHAAIMARAKPLVAKKGAKLTDVTFHDVADMSYHDTTFEIGAYVVETDNDLQLIDRTKWRNESDAAAGYAFDYRITKSRSYTWSMTAGATIAHEHTAEMPVPLPGGGKVGGKMSVSMTASSTSGTALSDSETTERTYRQDVGPRRGIAIEIYLRRISGHAPFRVSTRARGKAVLRIHYRSILGHGHHDEMVPLADLIGDAACRVVAAGVIHGIEGFQSEVATTPFPIDADAAAPDAAGPDDRAGDIGQGMSFPNLLDDLAASTTITRL